MMSSTIRRVFPALLLMASTAVHAGLISETSSDGEGTDLQSLFDGWVPDGYDVENNYQTPGYWTMGAAGGSFASLIIEIAGNASHNTFGLFDPHNINTRLEVYDGASDAGDQRSIYYDAGTHQYDVLSNKAPYLLDSAQFSGSTFGFYLDGPGGTFFSAPALNDDDIQMVAFEGNGQKVDFFGTGTKEWMTNEWVLAWEDLVYGSSDKDFNDLVLIIESVTPVPEPETITLLGAGLLGLLALRRRRTTF